MRNIQDWCISRQLWWGHSIPAWYCQKCEHVNVSRTDPTACAKCGSSELKADPDVLDTWFSSGLWPFSTLGWPKQTPDLAKFYPTSDMETGYDILFFWVARMMMMGIHFMGKAPFKRVLLAGMVTDENGDKMSKVKGNVIDPLDLIHGATLDQLLEKAKQNGTSESGIKNIRKTYPEGFAAYGSDAVRYTLLSYSPQARRIALSVEAHRGLPQLLQQAVERRALRHAAARRQERARHRRAPRGHAADQPLDPVAPRRRARGRQPGRSTSTASMTRRSRSTTSSGTSCATGTSS